MKRIFISLLCVGILGACSDDEAASGWNVAEGEGGNTDFGSEGDVIVTAGGDTYVATANGDTSGCADLGDGTCVDIADIEGRYCDEEGAQADIILDENGEVIDVICYPPADEGTPVSELVPDAEGNVELEQNQSGTVLVFGDDTNGEPLKGDLNLEGERTVLFGNGVDNTIIDGNLNITSNNSRVRGLTIQGNITFSSNANNSSVTFCKVHGDLDVASNGVTLANCDVFGDVNVTGNSATLTNIGVQGEWNVNDGSTCNGCYSFTDENEDYEIVAEDIGDALECSE